MNKRKFLGFIFSVFTILTTSKGWALSTELTLDFAQLGTTKVQIVVPDAALKSLPAQALPVILVVSGFQTSKQLAAAMSGSLGNNILIAFEYPLEDKTNWLDWSNPNDTKMASLIPAIPLQIVSLLNWIKGPDLMNQFGVTADSNRINVISVSLGIFFVPMALRLAQAQGIYENSVVLAYAGAKLNGVVTEQVRLAQGPLLAQLLAPVIQAITSPFEPTNFIGDIHPKHFLILNASEDQIFSQESQQALVDATPQPKQIISVPGVHIGLNQPERVASTIELFKNWLLENGAVNR